MTKYAAIIVTKNKAYLPTKAVTDAGFLQDVEPVFVVDLEPDKMTDALVRVLKAGNPRIPTPSLHDLDYRSRRNDPVLKATGDRNWKELGQHARSFLLAQSSEKITLDVHTPDKKGRLVTDPSKIQHFPPSADARDIVEVILKDVWAQSEPQKNTKEMTKP